MNDVIKELKRLARIFAREAAEHGKRSDAADETFGGSVLFGEECAYRDAADRIKARIRKLEGK